MRAYKFTADDAVSMFARFPWPVPGGGNPGAWVDGSETARVCGRGVHACRIGELPYWLGPELWEVELASDVIEAPYKLSAPRGRLLRRTEGWPEFERPLSESRFLGEDEGERVHQRGEDVVRYGPALDVSEGDHLALAVGKFLDGARHDGDRLLADQALSRQVGPRNRWRRRRYASGSCPGWVLDSYLMHMVVVTATPAAGLAAGGLRARI